MLCRRDITDRSTHSVPFYILLFLLLEIFNARFMQTTQNDDIKDFVFNQRRGVRAVHVSEKFILLILFA